MFRVAAIDIVAPVAALGLAVLAAGSAQAQQGYGAPRPRTIGAASMPARISAAASAMPIPPTRRG